MIFRRKDTPKQVTPEARERLAEIVEQYLADADDSTRRIVTADWREPLSSSAGSPSVRPAAR